MEISPARKWALSQLIFHDILEELGIHFTALQIPYMPIKGAFLICTGLAEKIKQRVIKDIDILVLPHDMQRASDYFSALKNVSVKKYFTDNSRPTETSLLYTSGKATVQVEIHSQINFHERFYLPTGELFARSIKAAEFLRLPKPEDGLLIFLCHLQSHIPFEFYTSNGEELNALISVKGFDWEEFWQNSKKTGLESFIYFILRYYSQKYPVPLRPSRRYPYASLLAKMFSETWYNRLPRWLRRVLFDIPFVRKPLWLLTHKISVVVEGAAGRFACTNKVSGKNVRKRNK